MIVFRGTLNEECEQYIQDRQKKFRVIKFIVLFCFCAWPGIVFGLLVHPLFYLLLACSLYLSLAGVLTDKSYKDRPKEIIIDDTCVEIIATTFDRVIPLEKISVIYDMGSWYKVKIDFKFNTLLVFQKDLIVEGTIEQFEQLFADKMIINAEQGGIGE